MGMVPLAYLLGECSVDGLFDIGDPITLLGFLFGPGATPPCEAACDFNSDGSIDIADVIEMLNTLFGSGSITPACVSGGLLGCGSYPYCP